MAHLGTADRGRQEGRDRPRHRGRPRGRAHVPRAWSPSGFPITPCWPRNSGGRPAPRARCCWIFDPLDGTTNYAHGLPIFCVVAGARDRRRASTVGAVYDPTRRELFTADARRRRLPERRPAARLVDGHPDRRAAGHRLSVHRPPVERASSSSLFAAFLVRGAGGAAARVGGARPVLRGGRAHGRRSGSST